MPCLAIVFVASRQPVGSLKAAVLLQPHGGCFLSRARETLDALMSLPTQTHVLRTIERVCVCTFWFAVVFIAAGDSFTRPASRPLPACPTDTKLPLYPQEL